MAPDIKNVDLQRLRGIMTTHAYSNKSIDVKKSASGVLSEMAANPVDLVKLNGALHNMIAKHEHDPNVANMKTIIEIQQSVEKACNLQKNAGKRSASGFEKQRNKLAHHPQRNAPTDAGAVLRQQRIEDQKLTNELQEAIDKAIGKLAEAGRKVKGQGFVDGKYNDKSAHAKIRQNELSFIGMKTDLGNLKKMPPGDKKNEEIRKLDIRMRQELTDMQKHPDDNVKKIGKVLAKVIDNLKLMEKKPAPSAKVMPAPRLR